MIIKIYYEGKYINVPAKTFAQSAREHKVTLTDFMQNVLLWAAMSVSDQKEVRRWVAACRKEFAKGRPPKAIKKNKK